MLCFKCNKETPNSEIYCRNCGVKLDFTFQEVQAQMKSTIRVERIQETKSYFAWILSMIVFALVVGLMFRSFWPPPPEPVLLPAYAPQFEVPDKTETIRHPLIIRE